MLEQGLLTADAATTISTPRFERHRSSARIFLVWRSRYKRDGNRLLPE